MAVFEIVVFCLEVGLVQVLFLDGKLARMEGEFTMMEGKSCVGGGREGCNGLEGDGCLKHIPVESSRANGTAGPYWAAMPGVHLIVCWPFSGHCSPSLPFCWLAAVNWGWLQLAGQRCTPPETLRLE